MLIIFEQKYVKSKKKKTLKTLKTKDTNHSATKKKL